ncbi:MAG: TonB-dependent receptor [Gammaproteobacteria bacterium]|nr:TonB-dependent receptor [Gammaproteobacteria bacterium]
MAPLGIPRRHAKQQPLATPVPDVAHSADARQGGPAPQGNRLPLRHHRRRHGHHHPRRLRRHGSPPGRHPPHSPPDSAPPADRPSHPRSLHPLARRRPPAPLSLPREPRSPHATDKARHLGFHSRFCDAVGVGARLRTFGELRRRHRGNRRRRFPHQTPRPPRRPRTRADARFGALRVGWRGPGRGHPAELTANTDSTIATQQSYLQGVSQFSLRGVGLSSTLTLINGRRAGFAPVSNDVGQSFFDINTLPVLLIERVEILRDGASATYGSQAVAGVANIVTRRGFSGLEFTGGYRTASNTAYDAGFAAGFETPRGYLSVYGAGLKQDENFRTDFAWMIPRAIDPDGDGDIVEGSFDSGRGSPGSFRRAVANPDGSYSPFQINGFDAPRFPDPDCRAGGGYPSGSLCRMDFSDQRTMIAAEERLQFFADAEYDLTHAITLFAEVGHSVNEVTDRVGNMLLFNGNVERTNEFFVPANHPFNFWTDPDGDGLLTWIAPAEWMPKVHEAVPLGYFGRPLGAEAFGDNSGYQPRQFENLRVVIGFDADLPGGWTGTGYIARARSNLAVRSERYWVAAEFAAVIVEGVWNPFGTRLVAPDLVTPKTVADDGLADALTGKRAANEPGIFARFDNTRDESIKSAQNVAEFVASGDLFEFRGEPVSLAAGTQFRELDYSFRPDPLSTAGGGPRENREFPVAADQRVWAVFAETLTYVGDRAEVQLAARHERYDEAGSSTDPKVAAKFDLSDLLSLRASWGTSFQAPSVFQVAGNASSRTIQTPSASTARASANARWTLPATSWAAATTSP